MFSLPTDRSIWRIDSGSVRSGIREVAKQVDSEGNRNGKVSVKEVEAFVKRYEASAPDSSTFETGRTAEVLKSYLESEPQQPLALDVALVIARRPMTRFSDWLGQVM